MGKYIVLSNKWKYTISLINKFTDYPSKDDIKVHSDDLINNLSKIIKGLNNSTLVEDDIYWAETVLEEVKYSFEFLNDLITGKILESDWDNYGFDGDYIEYFNRILSTLYDIGDVRVLTKRNVSEKFIFIRTRRNY